MMANGLQCAIYNLANVVPLALTMAVVWWFEFKTWRVPIILFTAAIAVAALFALCFRYGKNNCSVKRINVSKIISKDSWVVAYVITYVSPFAHMVMPDYHIVPFAVVVVLILVLVIPAVTALPNILLFLVGYHFYEIETKSTGVGDYMLISKRRRIRNKADVKTVMRVFEKLLIDTKGGE